MRLQKLLSISKHSHFIKLLTETFFRISQINLIKITSEIFEYTFQVIRLIK